MERPQLFDPVFFVFPFLILVFVPRRTPFRLENPRHFLERQLHSFAQLFHKSLDRRVHHAAEAHVRPRAFAQRPEISEQKLLWAPAVNFHPPSAEAPRPRGPPMETRRPTRPVREKS